jgi:hypothetical protein
MPGRVLLVAVVSLLSIASLPLAAADQPAVAYITARYADTPEPGAKARYSTRIVKLWAACTKKEKKTGDPCMDFDIWVNAQDWEIKNLKIEPLKSDAKTAGSWRASTISTGMRTSTSASSRTRPAGW